MGVAPWPPNLLFKKKKKNYFLEEKALDLVVLTILKNMKVNGKDYPVYYGK